LHVTKKIKLKKVNKDLGILQIAVNYIFET